MLTALRFNLPNNLMDNSVQGMKNAAQEMKEMARKSGVNNSAFQQAWKQTYDGLSQGRPIEQLIQNKYHVRAVGLMLTSPREQDKVPLSQKLLERITSVVKVIPTTLIESVYQRFLTDFSQLNDLGFICNWLRKIRSQKGQSTPFDEVIIHENGPKHLVDIALRDQIDFPDVVFNTGLQDYASGQFIQIAQKIFYLERLRAIPKNQPDDLLKEVAKPSVYEERYDDSSLLGHHILEILISRAPSADIDESWLNVIMGIAGDPRVPVGNQRYTKWWSHISESLRKKVRGWLSGLDLKLFLAALKDFSDSSWNSDLRRMYPSRKQFLEGIYDAGLITETRLFLSREADLFLRRSYHPDHLPLYDVIRDGDKSLIYVELQQGCMIEGSHSCYLWVYKHLPESINLKQRSNQTFSYSGLTSGLALKLNRDFHINPIDKIQHNPANFNWQRKGVDALKQLSLPVSMRDVLTPEDYKVYKRRFGAG